MNKKFLALAAFSMAIAVILGALGAHALKSVLSTEELESFKTGVRYQVWHSLAIILVQLIPTQLIGAKTKRRVSVFFFIGIVLFSFSILTLALSPVLHISRLAPIIGPITPLGGAMFIVGWVVLAISFLRR